MFTKLRCRLLIFGTHLYLLSDRPVENGQYAFDGKEIFKLVNGKAYGTLTLSVFKRVEASNDHDIHPVEGRLHDAFGDNKNFDPTKDYYFDLFLLPDGKFKTIMNGTVVCLPSQIPASV